MLDDYDMGDYYDYEALERDDYYNSLEKEEDEFYENLCDELQERIDEAILKIKDLYNDEYISYGNKEELINILEGEKNE